MNVTKHLGALNGRRSMLGFSALSVLFVALTLQTQPVAAKGKKPVLKSTVTMVGTIDVEVDKKSRVKGVVLVADDGTRMPIVLNKKARKLAKEFTGARVEVQGVKRVRKGVKGKNGKRAAATTQLRLKSYKAAPAVVPDDESDPSQEPEPAEDEPAPADDDME